MQFKKFNELINSEEAFFRFDIGCIVHYMDISICFYLEFTSRVI